MKRKSALFVFLAGAYFALPSTVANAYGSVVCYTTGDCDYGEEVCAPDHLWDFCCAGGAPEDRVCLFWCSDMQSDPCWGRTDIHD